MKFQVRYGVAVAALLAATSVGAAQQQQVTGPIAVYWMSAATTSGMGAMGAGGAPSASAIMGQMFGGGGRGGAPAANHSLTLQLGSSQRPSGGEAAAGHTTPPALRAGPVLPLVTPQQAPQREPTPGLPENFQRPKGKMQIFWGCGEHAGPNQPVVIDFSKIGPGMPAPNIPTINVRTEQAPSAGRFATYGEWPNSRSRATVPPDGSLVGAHSIKGNYSPPIAFTLAPGQDFLPPLNITSQNKTPQGGTRLTWNPVQGSLGYAAMIVGAGQDGGQTITMWSSSGASGMAYALMDYLPPAEVRRLVTERVVLSPQTTECTVPAEVTRAVPIGLLQMIAYGPEVDLGDPPRPADPRVPWNRQWSMKLRTKSTTGVMLGMPGGMGGGYGGDEDGPPQRGGPPNGRYPQNGQQQQQQQQQQRGRPGIGGALRGLGGIPGF